MEFIIDRKYVLKDIVGDHYIGTFIEERQSVLLMENVYAAKKCGRYEWGRGAPIGKRCIFVKDNIVFMIIEQEVTPL